METRDRFRRPKINGQTRPPPTCDTDAIFEERAYGTRDKSCGKKDVQVLDRTDGLDEAKEF